MSLADNGDALKKLHARIVDATNGYAEGIEQTDSREVIAFFDGFKALHERHALDIDALLRARGFEPQTDGSWMTWVQEGIMKVRGAVGTLDQSVKDDVVRGEEAILDLYDEALKPDVSDAGIRDLLTRQRAELQAKVTREKPVSYAA